MGPLLTRPLPALVGALAVARLARLITEDEIAQPLRDLAPEGRWATFVTCPWCVSIWLAGGWAALSVLAPSTAGTLGTMLAWSEVAGLAASVV